MNTTPMPGFERAARASLNHEGRELLHAATDGGARPHTLVVYCSPEDVRVLRADALADELARDGVGRLARRIRHTLVPMGHVLVVAVGDDIGLAVVPLEKLLNDTPTTTKGL